MIPQTPALHDANIPPGQNVHVGPHTVGSSLVSKHPPLGQRPSPPTQLEAVTHVPAEQMGVAVGHADPQPPQSDEDVARFWQLPEQFVVGNEHELAQVPWSQT